jgi:Collagen triple helix repeat (20 copies)
MESESGRVVAELRAEVMTFKSELASKFNDTVNQLQSEFAKRIQELRDGKNGDPGVQGPVGPAGDRGLQGETGAEGPAGPQGERGEIGAQGERGLQGESGPIGERGETGECGPSGERGEKGEPGPSGAMGERGEAGPAGEKGDAGERGETGSIGETGVQGNPGEPGPAGLRGEPGATGDKGEHGPIGNQGEKGERGEPGPIGEKGDIGESGEVGEKGEKGERGEPGPEGMLPIVKEFAIGKVHYAGDIVAHEGGLWQAKTDTGQTPPNSDWITLAAKGLDGKDGETFSVRGTWKEGLTYSRFDVVAIEGSAFVARCDKPGQCPGDDWQLIAAHGRQGIKGPPGHKGDRGEQGDPGASIVGWKIDQKKYTVTPIMSDGTQPTVLNLRELFEQFNAEVR